MTPYELRYGRKCQTPTCWLEPGEKHFAGPEIVQITANKVVVARDRLQVARERQKKYPDGKHRPKVFEVGEKVMLKVSPWKAIIRFGRCRKLGPDSLVRSRCSKEFVLKRIARRYRQNWMRFIARSILSQEEEEEKESREKSVGCGRSKQREEKKKRASCYEHLGHHVTGFVGKNFGFEREREEELAAWLASLVARSLAPRDLPARPIIVIYAYWLKCGVDPCLIEMIEVAKSVKVYATRCPCPTLTGVMLLEGGACVRMRLLDQDSCEEEEFEDVYNCSHEDSDHDLLLIMNFVSKNFYLKKKKRSSSKETSGCESQDYVTQRAKKLQDAYTKLVVKKYGEDNANHPMNVHRDLWEMATGVMKKGRAFGIPTNSTSAPRMSSTASSDAYHTSDLTFDHMQRWNVAQERVTRLEEGNKQTDEKVDDILKILNEDPLPPN
ncbi:hypothetical protein Tco_0604348 [Tanacetum coccineum]